MPTATPSATGKTATRKPRPDVRYSLAGVLCGAGLAFAVAAAGQFAPVYLALAVILLLLPAPVLVDKGVTYSIYTLGVLLPPAVVAVAGGGWIVPLGLLLLLAVPPLVLRSGSRSQGAEEELKRQHDKLVMLLTREKESAEEARATAEQARREAEKSREQAESAVVAKSRFLAAASHDLRQPLHAMGLMLHSLREELSSENQRHIFQQIGQSFEAVETLFNALLDISKLDAQALDVNIVSVDLRSILTDLDNDMRPLAQEQNLTFQVNSSNAIVKTDPVLLLRILRNLVTNALVHTEEGGVTVDITEKTQIIEITVADTGPGIPESEQRNIFNEFHQLNNPGRDRQKGLGLGLAIVQRLAKLLAHEISLKSKLGKGSRFTVVVARSTATLPPIKPAADTITDRNNPGPLNILIVDDEPQILQATAHLLKSWNHSAAMARDWQEAKAIIVRGFCPEFVICDYRLQNNVRGVDVLANINNYLGARVPAILVSGDTDPERINEARASGYALLHKPLKPAKLRAAIARTFLRIQSF